MLKDDETNHGGEHGGEHVASVWVVCEVLVCGAHAPRGCDHQSQYRDRDSCRHLW